MNRRTLPGVIFTFSLGFLLAACSLPLSTPTQDTADMNLRVALTLTAIQSKVLPSATPAIPPATATLTASPIPSATSTTTAPGVTPSPSVTFPVPTLSEEGVEPAPGLKIVYTDGGHNLWLWDGSSGKALQLTKSGDVSEGRITSDGKRLAFLRSSDGRDYSLWGINPDGSNETELVMASEFHNMAHAQDAVGAAPYVLDWVPGTHTLAFVTYPIFDGPGLQVNDDLWMVDVDSGGPKEMLSPGEGGVFYFSPDGKQMALVSPDSISLANADGSNLRKDVFKYTQVMVYSEYQFYATPKWSPDSTTLRVAIPPKEPLLEPRQATTIWQISASGSPAAKKIGSVTTAPLLFPTFSPDVEKIAFLKDVGSPTENHREVHIANADGTLDTIYQTGQFDFMNWAPDSTRFIYTRGAGVNVRIGQIGEAPVNASTDASPFLVEWLKNGNVLILERLSSDWVFRSGAPGGESQVLFTIKGKSQDYIPTFALKE
jgi:Tol biopolymer transport system component